MTRLQAVYDSPDKVNPENRESVGSLMWRPLTERAQPANSDVLALCPAGRRRAAAHDWAC